MDKQKQIEEMAKLVQGDMCGDVPCEECNYNGNMKILPKYCGTYLIAKKLYNAGYRKIPENAVVLTEERNKIICDRIEQLERVQVELQELNAKYYNEAKDLRREKTELQKQVEAWKAKARELEQSWEISSSNEVVLQKQVYELKNDLRKSVELIKEGGELAKMNNEIIAQVYEQAVKDTAKEILDDFDKHGVYSKDYTDFMRKEYGVEVE